MSHCASCGNTTAHRADYSGKLQCVRCTLEKSLPGYDAGTPAVSQPAVPMAEDEPRKRSKAEIIAAVITVLVVGFLIYAFIRRP